MNKKLVSIVVPCFNEGDNIDIFHQEVTAVIDKTDNVNYEIIFINDGSSDSTGEAIKALKSKHPCQIGYIELSRNFGKEAALLAGLEHAKGDAVIIIDADLQDPPSLIPQMIEEWQSGYDMVYTRRTDRTGEPKLRSWCARLFYSLMNKMSEVELESGVRDFRLIDRKIVINLLSMRERLRFSKGMFAWVGYPSKCIEYDNVKRATGETSWSFRKLFDYAIEGIVSFTYMPLRFASITGVMISFGAFIYLFYIVLDALIYGNPVSGYASLVSIVLFLGGIQLLFLGVIGEYLGRVFYELKSRPHYIVKDNLPSEIYEVKVTNKNTTEHEVSGAR